MKRSKGTNTPGVKAAKKGLKQAIKKSKKAAKRKLSQGAAAP